LDVFQDLGLVLGDKTVAIQVNDLTLLAAHDQESAPFGQGTSVQPHPLDRIRIRHWLQRLTNAAGLPARLAPTFSPVLSGRFRSWEAACCCWHC
jgi:hypothetical protein